MVYNFCNKITSMNTFFVVLIFYDDVIIPQIHVTTLKKRHFQVMIFKFLVNNKCLNYIEYIILRGFYSQKKYISIN